MAGVKIYRCEYSATNGDMWANYGWEATRAKAESKMRAFANAGHWVRITEDVADPDEIKIIEAEGK